MVDNTSTLDDDFQHGINIAKVVVIANSEYKEEGRLGRMSSAGMPVGLGKPVRYPTVEEVTFALGTTGNDFPYPCGHNRNE